MSFTTRDIQARCAALDCNPGPIDGMMGSRTRQAIQEALQARGGGSNIVDLFGVQRLHRIHWHWTAGATGIIALERRAYNCLVDHEGNRHDGDWRPEHQAQYSAGNFGASHTYMANTGAIGLSCDAMAGAQERPFNPGSAPMTWVQVFEMCTWTAEMCEAYDIPVTRYSVLMHSEIQPTLGIRQKWKWDLNWLPDMDKPGDPIEVGDRLRDYVREAMAGTKLAA